jgi:hypothetical protein
MACDNQPLAAGLTPAHTHAKGLHLLEFCPFSEPGLAPAQTLRQNLPTWTAGALICLPLARRPRIL